MKRFASILVALAALAWLLISGLGYFLVPFYGFRVDFSHGPRVAILAKGVVVRDGDRVLRLNGRSLKDPEELNRVLYEAAPGSPLSIEVERAGRRLALVQPPVPHSARVVAAQATSILAGLVLLAVGLTPPHRQARSPLLPLLHIGRPAPGRPA